MSTSPRTQTARSDYDDDDSGYINIGANITSNGGNITLGGGSGAITAGTLNADGTINVAATGYAVGILGSVYGVNIDSADISAGGGNIVINGRGYNGLTDFIHGVNIHGTTPSITTTGTGTISINGNGAGASAGTGQYNFAVALWDGAVIETVNGALHVVGYGSTAAAGGYPQSGLVIADGTLRSTGSGEVVVNGTAGNMSPYAAVHLFAANSVQTTGTGNIIVRGNTGGAGGVGFGHGILFETAGSISANGGNITLIGTGTGDMSGTGVLFASTGGVSTNGSGTITIIGDRSAQAGGNTADGVYIGDNTTISTVDGLITITGSGAPTANYNNIGVIFEDGATVTATGTGGITIAGTGNSSVGGGYPYHYGVEFIGTGTTVSTNSGNIAITGTGHIGDPGYAHHGIYLNGDDTSILSTSGNITLTGTSATGTNSYDIYIDGVDNVIASTSGTTTLIGTTARGIVIAPASGSATIGGGSITGNLFLTADTIALSTGTNFQTSGNITIHQYTNGTTIGVGAGAGTVSLNDTELGYFNWGTAAAGKSLTIGDINSGNITINTASTILNKNVNFITGGNISLITTALAHAGGAASTLGMYAYGNITTSSAITAAGSALNVWMQSDYNANSDGYINIGANITSNGGNITMGGGSGAITGTSHNADGTINVAASGFAVGNAGQVYGILVYNAIVNAGGGNIIANGQGFDTTTDNNYGVFIGSDNFPVTPGTITTTGAGTITVTGIGGGASGNSGGNIGVYLMGGGNSTGIISTVNGKLTVTGTGGGAGRGQWRRDYAHRHQRQHQHEQYW